MTSLKNSPSTSSRIHVLGSSLLSYSSLSSFSLSSREVSNRKSRRFLVTFVGFIFLFLAIAKFSRVTSYFVVRPATSWMKRTERVVDSHNYLCLVSWRIWLFFCLNRREKREAWLASDLKCTETGGWIHLAEDVELVERGEDDEDEVPRHQDDAVSAIQLPAVHMRRIHEEHHCRQQRNRRVRQTWGIRNLEVRLWVKKIQLKWLNC